MCGRYALGLRPFHVRQQLEDENMPVWDAPEDEGDDSPRASYNFAPGYYGLVYRADTPDWGAGPRHQNKGGDEAEEEEQGQEQEAVQQAQDATVRYKLQTMKWGLIPFWTKRNPDYATMLRTINCRDDSLLENKGMWTTMKHKKRCIVIAQGFYEWLKKPNSKEKIPHFTCRKDRKLMCMAGLWDCVQYEGSTEKLFTYTIITTDANKQISFLHDRMPVILDNGSEDIRTWLDPKRFTWSKELQLLLKPYKGELEIYPVSKDVGKVGNNSPSFIIPVNSSENKNNIANFFGNAGSPKKGKLETTGKTKTTKIKDEPSEDRKTIDHSGTEDNAPMPVPTETTKREHVDDIPDEEPPKKVTKVTSESPTKAKLTSPVKAVKKASRSATSNGTASPVKASGKDKGSQKITSFFTK